MIMRIPLDKLELNQVIEPYSGGGKYGVCLKCGRTGLKIVEVPVEKVKKPKGWRRIPQK